MIFYFSSTRGGGVIIPAIHLIMVKPLLGLQPQQRVLQGRVVWFQLEGRKEKKERGGGQPGVLHLNDSKRSNMFAHLMKYIFYNILQKHLKYMFYKHLLLIVGKEKQKLLPRTAYQQALQGNFFLLLFLYAQSFLDLLVKEQFLTLFFQAQHFVSLIRKCRQFIAL